MARTKKRIGNLMSPDSGFRCNGNSGQQTRGRGADAPLRQHEVAVARFHTRVQDTTLITVHSKVGLGDFYLICTSVLKLYPVHFKSYGKKG